MSTPPDKFEEGLQALEQIVERLETGDLSLEEALTSFEDGVGLVKHLRDKLTEVEKRIEILTRDQGGAFQLQPLTEDEEPQ
jgi:exodeoxyribonuclease VII small subunit